MTVKVKKQKLLRMHPKDKARGVSARDQWGDPKLRKKCGECGENRVVLMAVGFDWGEGTDEDFGFLCFDCGGDRLANQYAVRTQRVGTIKRRPRRLKVSIMKRKTRKLIIKRGSGQ